MLDSKDAARALLRISVAGLLLLHGIAKLRHGVSGIEGILTARGLPGFIAYGVFIGEVLAPLLVIVGYKTRLAALVMAINMVVATFLAHAGDLLSLNKGGGWAVELQALYLVGSICIALLGSGRYAISRGVGRWD